jgi:hypothetical protein
MTRKRKSLSTTPEEHSKPSFQDSKEEVSQEEEENNGIVCGICLENIDIQGELDNCKHYFCFSCIEKWSKTANVCPTCRREFRNITKIDVSTIKENFISYIWTERAFIVASQKSKN